MADSTLVNTPDIAPPFPPGHGTESLGPSDSSDSGSDSIGAGPGLGDADLDSDSDRNGTGERGTAGREIDIEPGSDITPDREIDSLMDIDTPEATLADAEEMAGESAADTDPDELAQAQLDADEDAAEFVDSRTPR